MINPVEEGIEGVDPARVDDVLDGLERLGDIVEDFHEGHNNTFRSGFEHHDARPCASCGTTEPGERMRFQPAMGYVSQRHAHGRAVRAHVRAARAHARKAALGRWLVLAACAPFGGSRRRAAGDWAEWRQIMQGLGMSPDQIAVEVQNLERGRPFQDSRLWPEDEATYQRHWGVPTGPARAFYNQPPGQRVRSAQRLAALTEAEATTPDLTVVVTTPFHASLMGNMGIPKDTVFEIDGYHHPRADGVYLSFQPPVPKGDPMAQMRIRLIPADPDVRAVLPMLVATPFEVMTAFDVVTAQNAPAEFDDEAQYFRRMPSVEDELERRRQLGRQPTPTRVDDTHIRSPAVTRPDRPMVI